MKNGGMEQPNAASECEPAVQSNVLLDITLCPGRFDCEICRKRQPDYKVSRGEEHVSPNPGGPISAALRAVNETATQGDQLVELGASLSSARALPVPTGR